MNKPLSLLIALALNAGTMFAQSDILVGDMNDDGQLTVGDITALTDAVLNPQKQSVISIKCDPNVSAPSAIAGQWCTMYGMALSLTAEGNAISSEDATVKSFEYFPYGRMLVLLNESGHAVKYIHVILLSDDYLILGQPDGSCTIYYPSERFASSFVLSATSLSLKTGETQQLTILATPEGSIAPSFTWASSNPAVATVSSNGLVTAVKSGTCTITATAQNGSSISVQCSVSVVQMVTAITLSESAVTLELDGTVKLTATVLPADANDRSFTWSSSNEDVAEVLKNGTVVALGCGTAVITATANDGSGVKAECVVSVAPKPLNFNVGGVSFNMMPVEHGTFQMGSESGDSDEKPVHSVTISQDYYIGETEVTQGLWYAVMGLRPTDDSEHQWDSGLGLGDNYPAYYFTWNDCQEFITKLNQLTGQTFRMPTEAEWEYAAKGGNKSKGYQYSGSNNLCDVAWFGQWNGKTYDNGNSGGKTHPVATKAPNELGVYDMSGNVREWCSDWHGSYSSTAVTDPTGAASGSYRVVRGGYWGTYATYCRTASRHCTAPMILGSALGFRLALSPSK